MNLLLNDQIILVLCNNLRVLLISMLTVPVRNCWLAESAKTHIFVRVLFFFHWMDMN